MANNAHIVFGWRRKGLNTTQNNTKYMEQNSPLVTKLGIRKVQKGTKSRILTIPHVATVTLGWKPQDIVEVSMIDNEYLVIKKVEKSTTPH